MSSDTIDLAGLNKRELRSLLDASRARGQAEAAYAILQEMAARREGDGANLSRRRRSSAPRTISLDLGDPMDRREAPDIPKWRGLGDFKSSPPPFDERPPAQSEDEEDDFSIPPVSDWKPPPHLQEPGFERGARRAAADVHARASVDRFSSRRKHRFHMAATFALGIAMGGGVERRLSESYWALPESFVSAALPEPEQTPPPEPVTVAARSKEPLEEVELSEAPHAAEFRVEPDALTVAVAPTAPKEAPAELPVEQGLAQAKPAARPSPTPSDERACAHEATPADKQICRDPQLQALQRRLRHAYAEALRAHEDRELLRERQLAWRSRRDNVSQPQRLAQVYEDRIRKLNAATQEARRLWAPRLDHG